MDPAQLQPGYRLDRYELLCPLAYGGMASVWLARFGGRLGFERMVVIKMILPQYSQDPRFKEMFLDEARIASKIEHSNVARILDVGEQEDNYFIVMEWVDGDSLSKILREAEQRKQSIPLGVAMRVVADAAAGLHAAHELKARDGTHLGVVHRDVSPQNILVANNGTTMIIDFGVAKARDRLSQETSAGQLKGKIRYMAPEQALGRPVDHRADIWALGAMLYEMFTGAPPYDGPNEVATLHKLTSGQRPAPIPPTMPEVLRAVVKKALGYDPDERFASALELSLALENAMVQINEPTSAAVVATYTGDLLADRKIARKQAVDVALEKARKRDDKRAAAQALAAGSADPQFPSSSGLSSASGGSAPSGTHSPAPQPQNEVPSIPSRAGERISLNEAPSSATLGSANMEYLPDPGLEESRRRRYVTAAALGVSIAAGMIGLILIITTVVPDKGDRKTAGSHSTESPVPTMPATSTSATIPLANPVPTTTSTASTTWTTTSAPVLTITLPPPTPTTQPSTGREPSNPGKPNVTPPSHRVPPPVESHKVSPVPAPKPPPPKQPPTPVTAPTGTIDRGF